MTYSRILIVRMSSLGDVVMTLPCLTVLRKAYPTAHLSWLVNKSYLSLLEGNPLLNEVIPFDRKMYSHFLNWYKFLSFGNGLREYHYDLVIDFQGLLRSAYLTYMTHAPVRVGTAENREGSAIFYTHKVPIRRVDYHGVDWHLQILKGIPGFSIPDHIQADFPLPDFTMVRDSLNQKLHLAGWNGQQPLIAIACGARWETKKWMMDRYAELADRLVSRHQCTVVLIGGSEDHELGLLIESQMKNKILNLIGKTTILEMGCLLQQAKLMIANDTGPLHLAVAIGTPVVAIYGPTNPKLTGPYGNKNTVVRVDVPCGPCCRKICPGYGLICMKNITTDQVYSAVLPYLE